MSGIETDLFLPQKPEQVWMALTDPALLAKWLMPNDFAPIVGHHFTFTAEPLPSQHFDGIITCAVLALEPTSRLVVSWKSGNLDSIVTWHLVQAGTDTRLFLRHDGFDDSDSTQVATKNILGGGWKGHLAKRLERTLATR